MDSRVQMVLQMLRVGEWTAVKLWPLLFSFCRIRKTLQTSFSFSLLSIEVLQGDSISWSLKVDPHSIWFMILLSSFPCFYARVIDINRLIKFTRYEGKKIRILNLIIQWMLKIKNFMEQKRREKEVFFPNRIK